MTSIPLSYLSATVSAGESRTPADASGSLQVPQTAARLGEPIPIVFCRRVNSNGGVFAAPKATEARFDGTENVAVDLFGDGSVIRYRDQLVCKYILVLSEGELPTIEIRDVFLGACREGTWNQSYNRRPQSWVPGVYGDIVAQLPEQCGTSGSYQGLTTLAVEVTPDKAEDWSRQAHVFVREGMKVTRLLDATLGPSNNFVDLVLYLMEQSKEIPSSLIDTAQMTIAANFTDANGLHFNGEVKEAANLLDWIQETAAGFLLKLVRKNGKFGLRPRANYDSSYLIDSSTVNWLYTFTEKHITQGGISIQYVSAEGRKPVNYEVLWRQQPEGEIGYVRSTVVRVKNATGQIQTIDLSAFCTSEAHAVKIAAYYVALRKYVTHYATITLRPGDYSVHLIVGDIVRLKLRNETKIGQSLSHDFLYEIQSIEGIADGTTVLTLMHYPINVLGRSILTRAVELATAPGSVYSTIRTSEDCDANSSTDNTGLGDLGVDFEDLLLDEDFEVFEEDELLEEVEPELLDLEEIDDGNENVDDGSADPEFDPIIPDPPNTPWEGPLPINDDGFEVNIDDLIIPDGDVIDIGDIDELDFDPESREPLNNPPGPEGPFPNQRESEFYPDNVDPQAVVDDLQPGDEAPGGDSTGLDREGDPIPLHELDEDGNPTKNELPIYLPYQLWKNKLTAFGGIKGFKTELTNAKNVLFKWYPGTSIIFNYEGSELPYGNSTIIKVRRVNDNNTETDVASSSAISNNYPSGTDIGYTAMAADINKQIKVYMQHPTDSNQEVLFGSAPVTVKSNELDYDFCHIKIEVTPPAGNLISDLPPNYGAGFAKSGTTPQFPDVPLPELQGVFPEFDTVDPSSQQHSFGEGVAGTNENTDGIRNYILDVRTVSAGLSLANNQLNILVNISAFKICFPELPNIKFVFLPKFGNSSLLGVSNPDPTALSVTTETTFIKGGIRNVTSPDYNYGISSTTDRPITATKSSFSTTDTFTVTSVLLDTSTADYYYYTNATAQTFTIDLNTFTVTRST